jgi:hypothetical protein
MGGFFGGGTTTKVTPGAGRPSTDPSQAAYSGAIAPYSVSNLGNQANLTEAGTSGLMYGANQAFNTLPGILQQGPGEAAYPQVAGDISNMIGKPMWDPYTTAASTGLPLADIQKNLMTDQNDPDLASAIASLGGSTATGERVSTGGAMPDVSASTQAILGPMMDTFRSQILPDIRSQALAAGAPGGNREFDLTGMATQKFGSGVASALAQHLAEMTNANANLAGQNTLAQRVEQEGQTSAGNLALQRAKMNQQGKQAAGELGISGINQGGLLASVLQNLGLTGPKAAVVSDAQNRDLATQRAMTPMALATQLMQGAGGIRATQPQWGPQTYPGGTTTSMGTPGAQAGAGVASIAALLPFLQGLGINPANIPSSILNWIGGLFGGGGGGTSPVDPNVLVDVLGNPDIVDMSPF